MRYRIIYLEDFWKWLKENKTAVDFNRVELNTLGKEPEWMKEKRTADFNAKQYIKTPWTKVEDEKLKYMLSQYKYGYTDISRELMRSEGAVKRRIFDLEIKMCPLKANNATLWTDEEVNTLIDLKQKGYRYEVIGMQLNRSAQSCRGKIERLENPESMKRYYRRERALLNA